MGEGGGAVTGIPTQLMRGVSPALAAKVQLPAFDGTSSTVPGGKLGVPGVQVTEIGPPTDPLLARHSPLPGGGVKLFPFTIGSVGGATDIGGGTAGTPDDGAAHCF